MPMFLAVPLVSDSSHLSGAVEKTILASDRYKLQADRGWLIKFEGTTVELSNKIGVTGQEKGSPLPVGSAIISPITGYFGRGPTEMWEWLKTRFEQ
jgi:hypothetical protein